MELYIPLAFLLYKGRMLKAFGLLIFQDTTGLSMLREGIFSWRSVMLVKQDGLAAP